MLLAGFKNFHLNVFAFTVNSLKIMFQYLAVIGPTYYYIIMITRTTLDGFVVGNTKSSVTSAEKYIIIKRILFLFRKKFMTTGNRKRYY